MAVWNKSPKYRWTLDEKTKPKVVCEHWGIVLPFISLTLTKNNLHSWVFSELQAKLRCRTSFYCNKTSPMMIIKQWVDLYYNKYSLQRHVNSVVGHDSGILTNRDSFSGQDTSKLKNQRGQVEMETLHSRFLCLGSLKPRSEMQDPLYTNTKFQRNKR